MSAIATLLAEMGHTVSGHDPSDDTPFLDPSAPWASRSTSARRAAAAGRRRGRLDRHPARPPAGGRRRRAAGMPVVHRSAALAAICADPAHAGRGRHPRQDDHLGAAGHAPAGAGQDPGFVVGAGDRRAGPQRRLGRRRPAGRRGRRERRHLPRPGRRGRASSPTSSPTTWSTGAARTALQAAFEQFVAALDGPGRPLRRRPGRGRPGRHAQPPVTYGTAAGADYRVDDVAHAGHRRPASPAPRRRAVGVDLPAAPGTTTPATPPAALALARHSGSPLAAAPGPGRFRGVARRFEVRGEAAGVVLVDDYAHLPTEVAAALAAARGRRLAPGRLLLPAPPLQPHRGAGPHLRRRLRRRRRAVVTDVYPAGEPPRPGVTRQARRRRRAGRPPVRRSPGSRRLDDLVGYLGTALRPGDLCLTLGAGDLTDVPDRVLGAARGAVA